MADSRANADVSPPSSHRASTSTAEQSSTDFVQGQNGAITQRRPAGTQPATDSTDVLVSQPTTNDTTVTIEQPDPNPGSAGPRRTVTIRQDHSQQQQAASQPQNNGASPQTASDTEKHDIQRTNSSFLSLLRSWWLELLALLLAAIIVVIIIVLLHYYHDKNVRSWNHNWAINSVFAFLTAILEAAVAFAVGSSLGQLRWLWYTKSHREMQLKWMDRLTNARSAPGAFRFAIGNVGTASRHWAGLGALLVVSLLGIGVFTQQVITVRGLERDIDSPGDTLPARVPISRLYEGQWEFGSTGFTPGDQMPKPWMASAVGTGFTYPLTNNEDAITNLVHCSTGNCTFGLYSTLSLCWDCANIADQILCGDLYQNKTQCPPGSLTRLPDDSVSLNATIGVVNITSDDSYPKLSKMSDIGPLVARFVGIGYWNTPAQAQECALYWCVKTRTARVEAGIFTETVTQSWTNLTAPRTSYGQDWHIGLYPDKCYKDGKESNECVFGVDPLSQRALQNYLIYGSNSTNSTGFLQGSVTIPPGSNGSSWFISSLAANAIISPCLALGYCHTYQHTFDMLHSGFKWMARYMSNTIRESTGGYSHGTTTRFDSFFHVRWGWLAYPIAVVLFALIFVLVTIYKSRGTEPWKSSVTALLFHGLVDEDRGAYLRLDDPVEMKNAENWVVTLQDHQGTRSFRIKALGSDGHEHHDTGDIQDGMVNVGMAILKASENAP